MYCKEKVWITIRLLLGIIKRESYMAYIGLIKIKRTYV